MSNPHFCNVCVLVNAVPQKTIPESVAARSPLCRLIGFRGEFVLMNIDYHVVLQFAIGKSEDKAFSEIDTNIETQIC